MDEKGMIFFVNKDLGKIFIYLGYVMFILGVLWLFLDKNGCFLKFLCFLKF